jgi:hypothetical protein
MSQKSKQPTKKRKLVRMKLSQTASRLLQALLDHQQQHRFVFRRFYRPEKVDDGLTTYGDIRAASGVTAAPRKLGPYLGEIARFCIANRIPPLNALVVNGKTRKPGESYLGSGGSSETEWKRDAFAALIFQYPENLLSYVKIKQD